MHIVHYAQKYGTVAEAFKHEDGVAVLGFFMETSKRDNVALRHIAQRLKPIVKEGSMTVLTHPLMLMDLLPDDTNNFYRYNGSLVNIYSMSSQLFTNHNFFRRFLPVMKPLSGLFSIHRSPFQNPRFIHSSYNRFHLS